MKTPKPLKKARRPGSGTSANSKANLRPVSSDPEKARAMGKKYGIATRPKCTGVARRTGKQCRNPAAYGTDRCLKHGARRKAGIASPHGDVQAARDYMASVDIPEELRRQPHWYNLRPSNRKAILRSAALLAAWLEAERGNWQPWRELTREPPPEAPAHNPTYGGRK